jgi:hypothetical protein
VPDAVTVIEAQTVTEGVTVPESVTVTGAVTKPVSEAVTKTVTPGGKWQGTDQGTDHTGRRDHRC